MLFRWKFIPLVAQKHECLAQTRANIFGQDHFVDVAEFSGLVGILKFVGVVGDQLFHLRVFVAGLAYLFALKFTDHETIGLVYHAFPATLPYFFMGVLLYHATKSPLTSARYVALTISTLLFAFAPKILDNNVILFAMFAVPLLFQITKSSGIDRFVGDLSYPLYLVHFPIIVVLRHFGIADNLLLWAALGASLIAALLLHLCVDLPVEAMRSRIRPTNASKKAEPSPSEGGAAQQSA